MTDYEQTPHPYPTAITCACGRTLYMHPYDDIPDAWNGQRLRHRDGSACRHQPIPGRRWQQANHPMSAGILMAPAECAHCGRDNCPGDCAGAAAARDRWMARVAEHWREDHP